MLECRYQVGDVVLEKWRLVKQIGAGGYACVFEAERSEYGAVYRSAIKIVTIPQSSLEVEQIRAELPDENSVYRYFQEKVEELAQEVRMMSQFKGNSHIISYEDHSIWKHTDDFGWDIIIRMELATPLYEHLKKDNLTRREVVQIGIDICKALELCQDHDVVHRDVKLDNLFISQNGDYKLGDFGVARIAEPSVSVSGGQGTVDYMAPEVYKEERYKDTVKRVDTYSLGLVLHRLLNHNRPPYLPPYPQTVTFNERRTVNSRRFGGEPVPAPFEGDDELNRIILKACAYDPYFRYETPLQMRMALEALIPTVSGDIVAYTYMFPSDKANPIASSNNKEKDPATKVKPKDKDPNTRVKPKGATAVSQNDAKEKEKKRRLLWIVGMAGVLALMFLALFYFRKPTITVELPEMVVMGTGYEAELEFTASAEPREKGLVWSGSDESVLSVEQGVLTGINTGEAIVTLTYGDSKAVCRVFVLDQDFGGQVYVLEDHEWYFNADEAGALVYVEGECYWYDTERTFSEEEAELLLMAALQELDTVFTDGGQGWLNCFSDMEKENDCGSVLFAENEQGETVIIVHDLRDTYILSLEQIKVAQVEEYTELRMAQGAVSMYVGDEIELVAFAVGADDSQVIARDLAWMSADPDVAVVEQGLLTAIAPGTVLITATDGTYSCVCSVTVEEQPPETTAYTEPEKKPEQENKPVATQPPATKPAATEPPATKPTATEPPATKPAVTEPPATKPEETEPPATQPVETEPPVTEPPATEPPETEPKGKAPGGYSIRLSPSSVYVYQTFYVTVNPDVSDYTKIVIHAVDPTGSRWDFVISSGNSYDLMVTQPELTGTWTIYADVYNDYGVYYGASSGARAYLKVSPLF